MIEAAYPGHDRAVNDEAIQWWKNLFREVFIDAGDVGEQRGRSQRRIMRLILDLHKNETTDKWEEDVKN